MKHLCYLIELVEERMAGFFSSETELAVFQEETALSSS